MTDPLDLDALEGKVKGAEATSRVNGWDRQFDLVWRGYSDEETVLTLGETRALIERLRAAEADVAELKDAAFGAQREWTEEMARAEAAEAKVAALVEAAIPVHAAKCGCLEPTWRGETCELGQAIEESQP